MEWKTQDPLSWVENRFTVGSLVWAKAQGWPWWPAIVDDDPDTGLNINRHIRMEILLFL